MLVRREETQVVTEGCRGEKVHVDVAETLSHQAPIFDKQHYLFMARDRRNRECRHELKNFPAIPERAAGELPDDKWVRHDVAAFESIDEIWIRPMEMIDPHGRVDENHAVRRRFAARAFGSVPPSFASRRALSRAISARRPS